MSSRRTSNVGKRGWSPVVTSVPPQSAREQWDAACARFVDACMDDDPEAATIALAEAFVALGRVETLPASRMAKRSQKNSTCGPPDPRTKPVPRVATGRYARAGGP